MGKKILGLGIAMLILAAMPSWARPGGGFVNYGSNGPTIGSLLPEVDFSKVEMGNLQGGQWNALNGYLDVKDNLRAQPSNLAGFILGISISAEQAKELGLVDALKGLAGADTSALSEEQKNLLKQISGTELDKLSTDTKIRVGVVYDPEKYAVTLALSIANDKNGDGKIDKDEVVQAAVTFAAPELVKQLQQIEENAEGAADTTVVLYEIKAVSEYINNLTEEELKSLKILEVSSDVHFVIKV